MFVHTGFYTEHNSNDLLQSTYYTFTPIPLTDSKFYDTDDELAAMLADAHRALGVLDGVVSLTADCEQIADLILLRESYYSKAIDYPDTDTRSIFGERCESAAYKDIRNIATAYRLAIDEKAKKQDRNSIFNNALHGNNPARRASTRTKPLFMRKSTVNYRQYNPTAPDEIWRAMSDINQYIDTNRSDTLIKAAMCHYQFEMIHPYDCYNGIVGRILIYQMLNKARLNGARFLSPSVQLYHHKAEYFDKLESTQKNGNYAAWIRFVISVITEAAQQGVDFIKHYNAFSKQEEESVSERPQSRADQTINVFKYFKKVVVSSIGEASEQLEISFPTASRAVAILQELGVLAQISEGSRNRIFAHVKLWKWFTSPE